MTVVIWFARVDVAPPEQDPFVPIPGSILEWCMAVIVWFVGVGVVPFQYNFHHFVPITGGPRERCTTRGPCSLLR